MGFFDFFVPKNVCFPPVYPNFVRQTCAPLIQTYKNTPENRKKPL